MAAHVQYLVILFYVLAAMRLTRLINFDTIMDWLHTVVGERFGPGGRLAEFLVCPWCIGMWVALLTAPYPVWLTGLPWAVYPVLALGTSMVIGLAAPASAEDTGFAPIAPEPPEQH